MQVSGTDDVMAGMKDVLGCFHDWLQEGAGGASHWTLEPENHEGWRVSIDEGGVYFFSYFPSQLSSCSMRCPGCACGFCTAQIAPVLKQPAVEARLGCALPWALGPHLLDAAANIAA